MNGQSNRLRLSRAIVHAALIVFSALFLIPLAWQLRSSVMTINEIFVSPPLLFPKVPQWRNYLDIFTIMPFAQYYANTVFIVAVNIVGALFSNTVIAFAFARLRFRGQRVMYSLSIATLMMPTAITMIPTFIEWHLFGGINTFLPLTVAATAGVEESDAGLASGLLNTMQQVGGAIERAADHQCRRGRAHGGDVGETGAAVFHAAGVGDEEDGEGHQSRQNDGDDAVAEHLNPGFDLAHFEPPLVFDDEAGHPPSSQDQS